MSGIKGHARIPPPGWEDIRAEAAISGTTAEAAAGKLLQMRAVELDAEMADPLRNGWEPPIWHVCDALIGWPWCYDRGFLKKCRMMNAECRMGEKTSEQANIEHRTSNIEHRTEQTDREVWDEFCERMRKLLGYERPVKALMILGGNRAAKSEYAAKRSMMMIAEKDGARVFAMHMSDPRSVRDQQPLFWKYMPAEWQVQTAGLTAYIKYKKKTGFSENSFITPNGSEGAFLNYMQDKDTALQGMEADLVAPDELIPADWVEDIMLRLATRAGVMIPTFTPINGYTPTVKIFCDGAKVVKTTRAYLCPRDGGEPDEAGALHLTREQYEELWRAVDGKRAALAAQSIPEDILAWLGSGEYGRQTTDDRPDKTDDRRRTADDRPDKTDDGRQTPDRIFDEVPRVMRCVDPRKAVVFFNPSDNPYGNPKEVIADLRKKTKAYVRERFYGQAEKTISVLIPKFSRAIHVVKAKEISERGTNYFFYDPASDRNSFMSWFRRCGVDTYLYREWPGRYMIPGVGIPGPWAIPSGRKDGRNDGAPGEGQKPAFGFGNLRYKFEMARLERWEDYQRWRAGNQTTDDGRRTPDRIRRMTDDRRQTTDRIRRTTDDGRQTTDRIRRTTDDGRRTTDRIRGGKEYPEEEELAEWDERNGAGELITSRFIDSRAASSPRIEKDRPVTLQTLFDELNVFFFLTPGADITDGVAKINSALDYEEAESQTPDARRQTPDQIRKEFLNPAHFFVSEECENSIYALENWMNADGQAGACKDPIDLIRYFFMAECEDVGPNDYRARGGVSYGRQTTDDGRQTRIFRKARRLPCSAR